MSNITVSSAVDTLMQAIDQAGIRDACQLGTSSNPSFSSVLFGGNAHLNSDGANILAQRNGANAQTFRVYRTFTDDANHERGSIRWVSNTLTIGTEQAGTGLARPLDLVSGGEMRILILGAARVRMDDAKLFPNTAGGYSIGTAALPFQNLFLQPSASLTPTVNGCLAIEATNNTTLTFKLRGSDGTVRSGTVTLA